MREGLGGEGAEMSVMGHIVSGPIGHEEDFSFYSE